MTFGFKRYGESKNAPGFSQTLGVWLKQMSDERADRSAPMRTWHGITPSARLAMMTICGRTAGICGSCENRRSMRSSFPCFWLIPTDQSW